MTEVFVVLGSQWGDEGKGKWIAELSRDVAITARFQGGNNAGHTIYSHGQKYVLHHLPSSTLNRGAVGAMLAGMVVNPIELIKEMDELSSAVEFTAENLWISERAHVITPWHIECDKSGESQQAKPIGTTKKGIGPTYTDRTRRTGLTMQALVNDTLRTAWLEEQMREADFARFYQQHADLWSQFEEAAAKLTPFVMNADTRVRKAIYKGKKVILEGAQGALLDRDHGTYPYVTSSHTTSGGAIASLGCDPRLITKIIGIGKFYLTRVGEGPFPTEIQGSVGDLLAQKGQEFGATTGRPRRCGWFDALAMKYAQEVNGFDGLYMNKLDILSGVGELKIAYSYQHPLLGELHDFPANAQVLAECQPKYQTLPGWKEDIGQVRQFAALPQAAQTYVKSIEELSGIRIEKIGVGPGAGDWLSH